MPPTAQDAVLEWLVGGGDSAAPDLPSSIGVTSGVLGLLGRLAQTFPGNPVGPAQTTNVGAAAAGLTPPRQALSAVVSIEGASVRVQMDGTEVTTTTGLLLTTGAVIVVTGRPSMEIVRFIGTAAGAIINALFFE